MEGLIILVWFLLMIAIFLGLIVTTYIAFVRGKNLMIVIPKFILSLFIYFVLTSLMLQPMFVMLYAGAHTNPIGNAFSPWGRLIMCTFVLLYACSGWLLCSLIYGRLIGRGKAKGE